MEIENRIKKLTNVFFLSRRARQSALSEQALEARYQMLRGWRNALARNLGIRPYRIMSNKILRTIAIVTPKTTEDLLKIPGIGPARQAKYGMAILERLRAKSLH